MKKVTLCLAKNSRFSKLSLFSTNAGKYNYAQLWCFMQFYCIALTLFLIMRN